jgi:hypothetical protein
MNDLKAHLDVYDDVGFLGYPRKIQIDKCPPLETAERKPNIRVGDLVAWDLSSGPRNMWWTARFGINPTGIVLDTRWSLADWNSTGVTNNIKDWKYFPEACVLWCNGELTNTSFGALKIRSRAK